MFPSTRKISLRIPDSPIEKQALRSRSFRRIVVTIGTLVFVIASLHSITTRSALRNELSHEYLNLYQHSPNLGWLASARFDDEKSSPLEVSNRQLVFTHGTVSRQNYVICRILF